MQLILRDDLLLAPVTLVHQGCQVEVSDLVVDTRSATTLLSTDVVARIGIVPEAGDILHVVRSIGGTEVVFSRRVDRRCRPYGFSETRRVCSTYLRSPRAAATRT